MRFASLPRRRLSADEYDQMIEAGILDEDDRVELLNGELIQMAAMGGPHVNCVMRLNHRITPAVLGRAFVLVQSSFRLSDFSEPEPDLVVIREREYDDRLAVSADVLLVIEVADSTLRSDRDVKIPMYAAEGIPEAWLVDVRRKRVTVYRDPTPDGYQTVTVHTRGAVLTPLAFPDLELRWEDIFGRG